MDFFDGREDTSQSVTYPILNPCVAVLSLIKPKLIQADSMGQQHMESGSLQVFIVRCLPYRRAAGKV
jgi:hypothetical protein